MEEVGYIYARTPTCYGKTMGHGGGFAAAP
jgi:hypothetical protein